MSREVNKANTAVTRISGLLGLARRAGGVAAGTEAAREAIRAGRARLVLTARDASPAQTAKVRRTLAGYPAPHTSWGSRGELGSAVGQPSLSVIAVTHAELATQLLEQLQGANEPAVVGGAEA